MPVSPRSPKRRESRRLVASLLLVASATVSAMSAQAQDEEAALADVRERIEALEQRAAAQHLERDAEARELRRLEMAISSASEVLTRLRAELTNVQNRLGSLSRERDEARSRLDGEKSAFGRQVRLSYMMGQTELFKLLLSQEAPAELGRMMTYYGYLNRRRSERIRSVSDDVARLSELARSTRETEAELARLEEQQSVQLASLRSARDARGRLLAELDASIRASGTEIERLRLEEQRLTDLLAELGDILAAFPDGADQPFAALKGQLPWPISGRLLGDFDEPRSGGPMRWNGVLLGSEAGTEVRAVYYGRVAYSDWLPGYGLLMILDHGDGYVSIYGYNQVLLRESGDWVEAGEVVARVGDTGGQAKPALFFQLRENGQAVDPNQWMRGPP